MHFGAHPVVTPASCNPLHITVWKHIHPSGALMVVLVEDQSTRWAALSRQLDHWPAPHSTSHKPAHDAKPPDSVTVAVLYEPL